MSEIKDSAVDKEVQKLVKIMADVLTQEQSLGVPVLTDVAVGPNWADAEDLPKYK